MTTGDPGLDALVLGGTMVGLVLLFAVLLGALWLAERTVPGLRAWLDRNVGPR